jgi:hypothetical protein
MVFTRIAITSYELAAHAWYGSDPCQHYFLCSLLIDSNLYYLESIRKEWREYILHLEFKWTHLKRMKPIKLLKCTGKMEKKSTPAVAWGAVEGASSYTHDRESREQRIPTPRTSEKKRLINSNNHSILLVHPIHESAPGPRNKDQRCIDLHLSNDFSSWNSLIVSVMIELLQHAWPTKQDDHWLGSSPVRCTCDGCHASQGRASLFCQSSLAV